MIAKAAVRPNECLGRDVLLQAPWPPSGACSEERRLLPPRLPTLESANAGSISIITRACIAPSIPPLAFRSLMSP
ncbi:hypothetical protein PsYK624_089470 [Phanerochaete sordida]|uniref:Uncharacterized protein n=1 Tax=Phanerochaete sordida TaxID=48140 RepID=A0A9P3GFH4_9APHY|nr:hypothetical protein PsYK624_089470 [Phanerochaete sordida]